MSIIEPEYFRRLRKDAHVELYLSANDGLRIDWPWRMQPPKEANQSYRDASETYIIDSDPQDDSVTNKDALDTAVDLDAHVASLQDVYQDLDNTVDALLDGLSLADDHDYGGKLLLPLQQPYIECWQEIGEPTDHWIGLGGLKDAPQRTRYEAARRFRDHVGYSPHVHGFGWGPVKESDTNPFLLAREIRNDPGLIDTMDYSTPVRSSMPPFTNGDEHSSVTAAYGGARLIRDLREVTSHPDQIPDPSDEQASFPIPPD